MDRTGVFGALSLIVPKELLPSWREARVVRSADWPAPLATNTKHLPDYGGVLPQELVLHGAAPEEELRERGYEAHAIAERRATGGGLRVIAHGVLRHPATVTDILGQLARDERVRMTHTIRMGGAIEIDAYFADYDTFLYWFDAFALLALEASNRGGTGHGVFLWDDACEEPVVFDVAVGAVVTVNAIDPQNSQKLIDRWSGRFEALARAAMR